MITKIELTVTVDIPDEIHPTESQIRQWVEFEVAGWGSMPPDNPLSEYGLSYLAEDIGPIYIE